ncbi:PadR family transcriptional regulator [Lysinibacillus sp. CTST325]
MKKDRFSEPSLFILISLAEKDCHGYAIMEDIEKNYSIKLGAGTLYGAITRLEKAGYIQVLASDDRKKPYRLTDAGREYLSNQIKDIQAITTLGAKRLGLI